MFGTAWWYTSALPEFWRLRQGDCVNLRKTWAAEQDPGSRHKHQKRQK